MNGNELRIFYRTFNYPPPPPTSKGSVNFKIVKGVRGVGFLQEIVRNGTFLYLPLSGTMKGQIVSISVNPKGDAEMAVHHVQNMTIMMITTFFFKSIIRGTDLFWMTD